MELHEIASNAADYMEEHGHAKHALRTLSGRVCLLGAINMIELGEDYNGGRTRTPSRITQSMGMDLSDAVEWNNNPNTKGEEVVQFLRDAAIKLTPDAVRECPGGGGA